MSEKEEEICDFDTSSETQGQMVWARESLNGREKMVRRKVKNGEKGSFLFFCPWVSEDDFDIYYIHFEITGYPCNLIGSQQCDLFLNRTIFCAKSHLFQIASFMF